jgi:hypothetical protein
MKRPSLRERAKAAAVRYTLKYWGYFNNSREAGRSFHAYCIGYLAGYRAAKRERK